jgi:hypothetical protein
MSFALILARLFGCACRGLSRRITFTPPRQALLHQFPNRPLIQHSDGCRHFDRNPKR